MERTIIDMTTYYQPDHIYVHCPACGAPLTPKTPVLIIKGTIICNKPACRAWGIEKREEEKRNA